MKNRYCQNWFSIKIPVSTNFYFSQLIRYVYWELFTFKQLHTYIQLDSLFIRKKYF